METSCSAPASSCRVPAGAAASPLLPGPRRRGLVGPRASANRMSSDRSLRQRAAPAYLSCTRELLTVARGGARELRGAERRQAAEEDGQCLPAYVTVSNDANPNFTVVDVEVADYSGLVRVIAWVLNGMDMLAVNAVLETSEDGLAHNTLWVATRSGKKLSDDRAALLAERLRDFVTYCAPSLESAAATEFSAGPVTVSNSEDDQYTVVTVREERPTPGFLLEVASILTGLNAQIAQGIIQGCTECGEDVPLVDPHLGGGRLLKFWVRDRTGAKLDYNHISALVYSLGLGLGFRGHLLTPPGQDMLMARK